MFSNTGSKTLENTLLERRLQRRKREDNSSGVSKSELSGIAGGLVTLGTRQYVSCLDVWVGLIKRVKAQSARYGS